MTVLGDQIKVVVQIANRMGEQIAVAMRQVGEAFQRAFPNTWAQREARRAAAKRVHTAYRKKKRGRW